MKDFFKKSGIAVICVAVAIALLSLVTFTLSAGNSDAVSGFGNVLMKPMKSMMTSFIQSLEKIYGYMYRYDRIVEENEQLKAHVAELEQEYRDYSAISEENERLNALLGFSSKHSNFKYESATIISWTASNWASTFTIGKGSNSGIEMGDCVITENGYLVGKVTELGSSTATITTILDTSSSVGALVYASSEVTTAEGDYKLLQQGKVKLAYLSEDSSVATGDTIITSGKGGQYPQGLVIGYVADIYKAGGGLSDYASIEPAAKINNLTHVFIIIDQETES